MASVVTGPRRSTMDPIKLSAPLGGALVFLGLDRSIPLLHGSQGCSAFAKAFLTKHFREPIPMQTTAVTELSAMLGPAANLLAALDTVRARLAPEVIGILTTGLTEAAGEDLDGALAAYRAGPQLGPAPLLVPVSTPDFLGGLSEGWSAALAALVTAALRRPAPQWQAGRAPAPAERPGPAVLPLLAGVSLTAADLDELGWLVRGFGLRPLLVPDLSGSLDGHLGAGWSPLTSGGTSAVDLGLLHGATVAHAVGSTAAAAGAALAALTGAQVTARAHLVGLDAVDGFVAQLWRHTGLEVPADVRRWRARLADTLLDTHFVLGGARVAIAAEPEHLTGIATLLAGVGAEVVAAVAPTPAAVLAEAPCEQVVIGDLEDLRERAAEAGAELVIGSSHAGRIAAELGAAHLPAGMPVHDRFGVALRGLAGYRGGTHFLTDAANRLLDREQQRPAPTPAEDHLLEELTC